MKEPKWLSIKAVLQVHYEQIREHGGSDGIRDQGILDSAMARPKNLFLYEEPPIERLAAAYASGIIKNHPFVDGNKRTGFLAAYSFLRRNGLELVAKEAEAANIFLAFAAGNLSDEDMALWIKDHIVPRPLL